LVRIASARKILEASTSASVIHPSEIVFETDTFSVVPIPPELSDLPLKVLDFLSKGVYLQSTLLVYQLESS